MKLINTIAATLVSVFAVSALATNAAPAANTTAKPALTADAAKADGFALIHVADLEQWMTTAKATTHVYDANSAETRQQDGLIPGAVALDSSSHYSLATLPKDKTDKVVFYCANTACMASHDAAKVAVKAGYKNVFVMADGIQGWKSAGKPTQAFKKS